MHQSNKLPLLVLALGRRMTLWVMWGEMLVKTVTVNNNNNNNHSITI